jgi:hypothetical protein
MSSLYGFCIPGTSDSGRHPLGYMQQQQQQQQQQQRQQQQQQQRQYPIDMLCSSISISNSNSSTHPDMRWVDSVGAKELSQLLPHQRDQLFEEIHGVSSIPEEGPELIATSLLQLEEELGRIRSSSSSSSHSTTTTTTNSTNYHSHSTSTTTTMNLDKSAYQKASFLAPSLVKNVSFRLLFLRATQFHVVHAAERMLQHFQYKAELFGMEKVAKTITWEDDLTDDDRMAVQSGAIQLLPSHDQSGRRVCFIALQFSNYKTIQNQACEKRKKKVFHGCIVLYVCLRFCSSGWFWGVGLDVFFSLGPTVYSSLLLLIAVYAFLCVCVCMVPIPFSIR